MQNESEDIARRELAPNEIIRIVKERYRICRYLSAVAAAWVTCGCLMYFVWLGLAYSNSILRMVAFVLQTVGFAALTFAYALKLATYRCPVCDVSLGRLKDEYLCPNCNAQVKLPK
jgi:hypothetical protein